jgi:hypothetical protein
VKENKQQKERQAHAGAGEEERTEQGRAEQ